MLRAGQGEAEGAAELAAAPSGCWFCPWDVPSCPCCWVCHCWCCTRPSVRSALQSRCLRAGGAQESRRAGFKAGSARVWLSCRSTSVQQLCTSVQLLLGACQCLCRVLVLFSAFSITHARTGGHLSWQSAASLSSTSTALPSAHGRSLLFS